MDNQKNTDGIEKNSLIAFAVGQDIVIVNNDGICVASTNSKKIGNKIQIKNSENLEKDSFRVGHLKIPLRFTKGQFTDNEMVFVKNLAKMALEQYFSTLSQPFSTIDQFIVELIEKPLNAQDISRLNKQAQSFGLNLEVKRTAILIKIENFEEMNLLNDRGTNYTNEDIINDWKEKIIYSISNFFTVKSDIISTYVGNGYFVFFKELVGDEEKFIQNMKSAYLNIFASLIDSTKGNLTVVFSDAHSGIEGLYESYHEANQALKFGGKVLGGKSQSYYYGDLGAVRILTEEDVIKKKKFAKEVLEPLDKETLRQTLEVFFNENMDIKKAASKLKVHPNTVSYRLEKIAEILDLDPRVFKQAFELRIALLTDNIF